MKIGVPCSKLLKFDDAIYVNKENEAVAIAFGATLANKKPIVFLQNSGLGNIVDIITSLLRPCNADIHLIISIRHKPEHHSYMGAITYSMLKLMEYYNFEVVEE